MDLAAYSQDQASGRSGVTSAVHELDTQITIAARSHFFKRAAWALKVT